MKNFIRSYDVNFASRHAMHYLYNLPASVWDFRATHPVNLSL